MLITSGYRVVFVVYGPCVAKLTSKASFVHLIMGRCVELLRMGLVLGMVVRSGEVFMFRG